MKQSSSLGSEREPPSSEKSSYIPLWIPPSKRGGEEEEEEDKEEEDKEEEEEEREEEGCITESASAQPHSFSNIPLQHSIHSLFLRHSSPFVCPSTARVMKVYFIIYAPNEPGLKERGRMRDRPLNLPSQGFQPTVIHSRPFPSDLRRAPIGSRP